MENQAVEESYNIVLSYAIPSIITFSATCILLIASVIIFFYTNRKLASERLARSSAFNTEHVSVLLEEDADKNTEEPETKVDINKTQPLDYYTSTNQMGAKIYHILEKDEIVYWCDVPLYYKKHKRTLYNNFSFGSVSILQSLLFGAISSAIVGDLEKGLVTSSFGAVATMVPILFCVHLTLSLLDTNILYALTSNRIILCKRKGFFRNKLLCVSHPYSEIDGLIDEQNLIGSSNRSECGDVLFLKNNKNLTDNVAAEEWKVEVEPGNKRSTHLGFKDIAHADEVEEIIAAMLDVIHATPTHPPSV
ncbi:ampp [Acrasis kona]|uniref:Ampp n=1 Tax=Acrasis kona TaxID=1008807 RepID=A0AAW2ZNT2_9EUKA